MHRASSDAIKKSRHCEQIICRRWRTERAGKATSPVRSGTPGGLLRLREEINIAQSYTADRTSAVLGGIPLTEIATKNAKTEKHERISIHAGQNRSSLQKSL